MTDTQLLHMISSARFVHPEQIRQKANSLSINGQLGRMYRCGMLERVPGQHCFLYRSRQQVIA